MSLKTGIVGCGKVGDFHAKAYSQLGSSAFAAVCDADIDRARAFAERYHVRAYADVAEMIQTEGLDVVSNSQNPALYGKVHIFGENGAGVGVQTDGGAMFIAGMSAGLDSKRTTCTPCNDVSCCNISTSKSRDGASSPINGLSRIKICGRLKSVRTIKNLRKSPLER